MRNATIGFLLVLLFTSLPFAAKDKHAPLPPQILIAKTIYRSISFSLGIV